jgi:hypothetical protein
MLRKCLSIASSVGIVLTVTMSTPSAAQPRPNQVGDSRDDGLTLICWGEGRKPGTGVSTGYAYDNDRNKFVPQTYVHNTTEQFDSEVQMEFRDGRGRIHLTGKLIPPIHSGGTNGWWELENVAFGPDKINARYRLNGMNKPQVEIDRRSGRVKIDGIEKFRGECEQGNWGQRGNRF